MASHPTKVDTTNGLASQAEQEINYETIGRLYEELSEAQKLFANKREAQNKLFLEQSRHKSVASQAYRLKEDSLNLVHATKMQLELHRGDFQENADAYSRAEAETQQTQLEYEKASQECSMWEKEVENAKKNIDNSLKKLQEGFSNNIGQKRKASTPDPETPVKRQKKPRRGRHNAYVEDDPTAD